jgi:multiple sugar transport system permease protein
VRTEWGPLMAAATLMVSPIVVLFFLTQRTFIQGITLTGIKG